MQIPKDGKIPDNAKFGKKLKQKVNENKFDKSTQDTESEKIVKH